MVVTGQTAAVRSVPETLVIETVTGGEDTNPIDKPKLGNEQLHQALVASLQGSGLFRDVVAIGGGRYRLIPVIEFQELTGIWENLQQLAVSYSLIDETSGVTVWSDTFNSIELMTAKDVFVGQERMRRLLEAVVQDNISQLLAGLDRWAAENPEAL